MKLEEFGTHIIAAVIGTVVGSVLGYYFSRGVIDGIAVAVAVVLLGIVAITSARSLKKSAQILDIVAEEHPAIEVYASSSLARTEIYTAARRLVDEASESIRVLSHHASGYIESSTRDNYFDRLEEKVLAKHGGKETFLYHRAYQVSSASPGISEESVGKREYLHFQRLRSLASDRAFSRTKVAFSKAPLVADTALIIVDKKAALIGLLQVTNTGPVVSLAIEITDNSGRLISRLIEFFDTIGGEALT